MKVWTALSKGDIARLKKGKDLYEEDYYPAFAYFENVSKTPLSLTYMRQYWYQGCRDMKFRWDKKLVELDVHAADVGFDTEKQMLEFRHDCMVQNKSAEVEFRRLVLDMVVAIYNIDITYSGLQCIKPVKAFRPELLPVLSCTMYIHSDGYQRVVDGAGNTRLLNLSESIQWQLFNGFNGYLEDMTYSEVTNGCNGVTRKELNKMFGKVTDEEDFMTMAELKRKRGIK